MFNRSLPENFLLYRHALLLHKLMNSHSHTCEWVHLNSNQILTSRQTTFMSRKSNNKWVGLNAFANRVFVLNGRIPLDWLNMSITTFKVHCKREFLSWWLIVNIALITQCKKNCDNRMWKLLNICYKSELSYQDDK